MEIDQKITDLARKYFELPENVNVTTYDGRAFLNAIDKKYDVIMVDAYQDITIPFQMSSTQFFNLVKDHLNDDGVMVVNMNMRGEEEGNINQYLADTIGTVFSEIYTVDDKGEHIYNINQGNRISIQLAVIAGILTVAQQEFGQQYPFVTDAPVSALGGDNKKSTIQTMIDAFEQSIIIVKDDASSLNKDSDEIRSLILNNKSVGAVYELSMSEATTKDEQYTVVKKIKG